MYPTDRKYTKEHEWVRVSGGTAEVGITEYAQKQLGDIVFVDVPTVGMTVPANEEFGTVESVKSVSVLYMPVGGKVGEVNPDLESEPELINMEPHDTWMIKFQISDKKQLDGLMTADAYEKYLASEGN
ncbi:MULTISPECIES: glycine cleavage system protein GcvH [unclassified Streptomyces]|jgi:glycine cleavage system H protein|uniref:glycine cleavage system protein GcvH n=1 Tax=Streptomyces TaxID=1883 RepID=UPI0033D19DDE